MRTPDHKSLMRSWLEGRGAYISPKVTARTIEGRGTSVICTGDLTQGETIIEIPPGLLLNARTASLKDKNLTSHQLLAAELSIREDPWTEILPNDFNGFPLCWELVQRQELPAKYRGQVEGQLRKFSDDYEVYQREMGVLAVSAERFKKFWLQVNSRCLYWDLGLSREDNMTLAPFVDLFNHTGYQDVSVKIDRHPLRGSMIVRAPKLRAGQEVCLNYGPHENGFLLCEYGFVESNNPWDFIDITPQIQIGLPSNALSKLDELGYAGDYSVGRHFEPSFRTQVALASMQSIGKPLERFVTGFDDGSCFAEESMLTLVSIKLDVITKIKKYTNSSERWEIRLLYSEYAKLLK